MPAQTSSPQIAFYGEGDTEPDLERVIYDENDEPLDLTGKTVTIIIAHQSYSHYYSPGTRIVDRAACTPDPDQSTNPGRVTWTPGAGDLYPAGDYEFSYRVDGRTVPPISSNKLHVQAQLGGSDDQYD